MTSRRIIRDLVSATLLFVSGGLAADMLTGAPNQTAQLDMLLMPSDVAIGSDGRAYVVDLSLIHISEPTRQESRSRMPSSA